MANSTDVVKHLYDGTITVSDATGTPVTATIYWSQGDFTATGLSAVQRDVIAYQTRGTLHSVRYTALNFPTFSFSFMFGSFTDGTDVAPMDFFLFSNKYSTNVTTLSNPAEVKAINVILTISGASLGDSADHVLTLPKSVCTIDFSEGEPNTCTINGTVYGTPTRTGPA